METTHTEIDKQIIDTLNELIEVCKDGEQGFMTAAEGFKDDQMKRQCQDYSRQRGQFARELQEQVRNYAGDPEARGSVAGSLHRGWINIKAVVTGHDERALISECERGEDVAKAAYQKALDSENLPSGLKQLIQRQYTDVKRVHDLFRAMEKAA